MKKVLTTIVKQFSYLNNKYLYAVAAIMTLPCIGEASEAGSQLKEGVGKITGIIMTFAFLLAVAFAVVGGIKFAKGEKETGKVMIIGGGLVAAAVVIITILFTAFGMQDATSEASFDF
jgi:hypothetical protein